MKKNLFLLLAVAPGFFLASGCNEDSVLPREEQPNIETASLVPGHIRLLVSEELAAQLEAQADRQGIVKCTGTKSSDDLLTGIGVEYMTRTFPYAGRFEARTRARGMHLWYDVYFDENVPLTKAGSDLSRIEGVTDIEYRPKIGRSNYQIVNVPEAPAAKPAGGSTHFNDPRLAQQWHYLNDGTYKGKAGCDVNVEPVWKKYTTGSPEIIVSVVDGGVDYDHEDLAANMWVNEAELNGEPGVDDDGNGYVDDIYGYDFVNRSGTITGDDHGTHVAGTIAAVNNNEIGVSGLAGGDAAANQQGVRIMTCQIFIGKRTGNSSAAIKYGADNGAVISQNSWGYEDLNYVYSSDKDAIDYFIENAGVDENGNQTGPMKGGIVIFAAGNDNNPYGSPAMYPSAFAVASVAADYTRAYYSNYGDWADIAAPGGDAYKNQMILSTTNGNRYGTMQGTSMACPHVSGVAALIVSQFGGPGFTPDKLRTMIQDSSNPVIYEYNDSKYQDKLGVGLIDAAKAMSAGSTIAPDPVTGFTAEAAGANISLNWTIPADEDDEFPTFFNIYYSDQPFDGSLDRSNLPESVRTERISNEKPAGESIHHVLRTVRPETLYYVAVDASDNSRNLSELSEVKQVTTGTNQAPVFKTDPLDKTLTYATVVTETVIFEDPDFDAMTWELNTPNQAVSARETEPGSLEVTFDGSLAAPGSYEASITVKDDKEASATLKISYTILANQAPVLVGEIPDVIIPAVGEKGEFDISRYIQDPDGESLSYSFAVNPNGTARVAAAGNLVVVTALKTGTAEISVTAYDKAGAEVKTAFRTAVLDTTQPVSCYPNPVTPGEKLYIRTSKVEKAPATVTLSDISGKEVFSGQFEISAMQPAAIEMDGMDGGQYTVRILIDGQTYTRQIVKL